ILEKVDHKVNLVVPEPAFYPQVGFDSPFPCEVVRPNTRFMDGFDTGDAPYIACTLINFGQVREADVIDDAVVTHGTVRGPDLEIIEPRCHFLHKFVARRYPTDRHRREETILPAGLEVFRTGVSKVYIQQVGVTVTIREPARYALIAQWDRLQVAGGIVGI